MTLARAPSSLVSVNDECRKTYKCILSDHFRTLIHIFVVASGIILDSNLGTTSVLY